MPASYAPARLPSSLQAAEHAQTTEELKKSFEHLYKGERENGEPLCTAEEKFFGVLWTIKGDLDWYCKTLRFKNYNNNKPCNLCPANKKGPISMQPTCLSLRKAQTEDYEKTTNSKRRK